MSGKPILKAHLIEKDGKSYYNTYNLLRGSDQWDPLNGKDAVAVASADKIPAMLSLETTDEVIVSGSNDAVIFGKVKYFY